MDEFQNSSIIGQELKYTYSNALLKFLNLLSLFYTGILRSQNQIGSLGFMEVILKYVLHQIYLFFFSQSLK
jgi:hypothetical protein